MSETKQSLYDRLGGVYSIAAVIDDFIDRVMSDPIMNANPLVDEAHQRVTAAGFKYLVTEFVCDAIGGPQQYSGKSMNDSHAHLNITDAEWDAFMFCLAQSAYLFEIPEPERSELVAAVESLKGEIVR